MGYLESDSIRGKNAVIQMDGRARMNSDVIWAEVVMKYDPDTASIEVIRSDYPELPPGRYHRDWHGDD